MRAEIFWIADIPVGRLAVLPRPRGGDWLEDEVKSLRQAGIDVLVSLLTADEVSELGLADEATCCAACGVQFFSSPISDRGIPADSREACRFVRALTDLVDSGKAVAVHCRQGVGRSALVAACVLVALGSRPDAAFERIAQARGCPVPDTDEQCSWLVTFAARYCTNGKSPSA